MTSTRLPHFLRLYKNEVAVLKAVLPGGYSGGLGNSTDKKKSKFKWNLKLGSTTKEPNFMADGCCGHGLHGWLEGMGKPSSFTGSDQNPNKFLWFVLGVHKDELDFIDGTLHKVKFPKARLLYKGQRDKALSIIRKLSGNEVTMWQNFGLLEQDTFNLLPYGATAIIPPACVIHIPEHNYSYNISTIIKVKGKYIIQKQDICDAGSTYVGLNDGSLARYELGDIKYYIERLKYSHNKIPDIKVQTQLSCYYQPSYNKCRDLEFNSINLSKYHGKV